MKGGYELRSLAPATEATEERLGLLECNINISELKLLEKSLAIDSCDVGVLAGECLGLYTDPSDGGPGGLGSFLTLTKRTTSIVVHIISTESRQS